MASDGMVLDENSEVSDDTENNLISTNNNDCGMDEKTSMDADDNSNSKLNGTKNNNDNNENSNNNNENSSNNNNNNENENANANESSIFPDRATRAIKENHGCFIKSLKVCPFAGSKNLVATAGSNQVSVYDSTHRGNFFDLVSSYYNFPNVASKNIAITDDTDKANTQAAYKQSKIKYKSEELASVAFNDITWIKREKENDLWIAAACNDGNIYIISLTFSKCELVFPASKYAIEQLTTHTDAQYSSNVIVSVDAANVTKFWDIDSIDKNKLEFDQMGFITNEEPMPCLLEIKDDLQCITLVTSNNNDGNNTHLLYGITKNGYLKSYLIDPNACNGENDENDSKNENEDALDMMMCLDNENNNNKNKLKAMKWSSNVILNEKIKYGVNKNKTVKPVSMRWRPGKDYKKQIVIADMDAQFILYNISTKQVLQTFEMRGGMTLSDESTDLPQYSFDLSKNGQYIVYGNDNGVTYIYDLNAQKVCKRLKPSKSRKTAAVFHSRFAEPNEHSVIVVGESILWKYDRANWVDQYHDTSAFFQYLKPFSQLQTAIDTYVDF